MQVLHKGETITYSHRNQHFNSDEYEQVYYNALNRFNCLLMARNYSGSITLHW
jgi:hypothetical protein